MSTTRASYSWVVRYTDGIVVPQYPQCVAPFTSTDEENRYVDIDRSRVASFDAVRTETGEVVLSVYLDPGARWIWRRRVFLHQVSGRQTVFYLAGWQKTVGGENVQSIAIIEEDTGRIHMIGRWRDDHPLFYAIELIKGVECEKETT